MVEEKPRITKTFDEYEIMVERLRRIDKKEYDSENEHRFILECIKACFKETIHQRDYIKQLESKIKEYKDIMGTPIQDIMKRLKILEEMREYIKPIDYGEKYRNRYVLQVGSEIYHLLLEEDFNRWVRWLENDK